MKRRILSLVTAFAMLMSMVVTAGATSTDFMDMPAEGYWSTAALEAAVENGLLQGSDGYLDPTGDLTRAQMAAIVVRAFGAEEEASLSSYTDVSSAKWYYSELAAAVQMGIISGSGSSMRPDDAITRQEAFAILARAFALPDGDESALADFGDADSVSVWAIPEVAAMVEAGYVSGSNGYLNPTDTISRQEFAQVMYNMIQDYITQAGTYTEVAEGTVMINTPDVTLSDVTVTGNLVIGDGVGDGDITLHNVTVEGTTLVRGGGENSIYATGSTNLGNVVVAKVGGDVSLKLSDDATATSIEIQVEGVSLDGLPEGVSVTVAEDVTSAIVNGETVLGGETTEAEEGSSPGSSSSSNPSVTPNPDPDPTPGLGTSTTALSFKASSYDVTVGTDLSFDTSCINNDGTSPVTVTVTSGESLVAVDGSGTDTLTLGAKELGTVQITATANGVTATALVNIVAPVSGDNLTVTVDGTVLSNLTLGTLTVDVGSDGDITIQNCTIASLVVQSGGTNSVEIQGGSVANLSIPSDNEDGTRIAVSDGVVVSAISNAASGTSLESEGDATIGSVTTSDAFTVKNTTVDQITSTGGLSLSGSTAQNVTTSSGLTTDDTSKVGTIAASGSATINAAGQVDAVTGSANTISLTNSGSTNVTASADIVTVAGDSSPVVSGAVTTVKVDADSNTSTSITVNGTVDAITTSGTGSVSSITVAGTSSPTITADAPVSTVVATEDASPIVAGSAIVSTVVTDSSQTINITAETEIVRATDTTKVTTEADNVVQTTVTLQRIAVTTMPTTTVYNTTDEFSSAGAVVTGYYTVTGFEGEVSKVVTATFAEGTGKNGVITATYEGKTATFAISRVAKQVSYITIAQLPQVSYDVNDTELSLSSGSIIVNYVAPYASETVAMTAGTITDTGYSSSNLGSQTITLVYTNGDGAGSASTSFTITLRDVAGEELATAQATARATLDNQLFTYIATGNYSTTGIANLMAARDAGYVAINAVTTSDSYLSAVATAQNTALTSMAVVLTQTGEWQAEADGFTTTFDTILTKDVASVVATDRTAVVTALYAYNNTLSEGAQNLLTTEKTKLNAILAAVVEAEAEIIVDDQQTSAKDALDAAVAEGGTYDSANYATYNASTVTGAVTAGKDAIDAADTVEEVNTALADALAALAVIPTDAQVTAANLAAAKTTAVTELSTYWGIIEAQADYDLTEQLTIQTLQTVGAAAINTAENTSAVETALTTAKTSIDAVSTSAEKVAAALDAAKDAAIAELGNYWGAHEVKEDYTNDTYGQDAIEAIQANTEDINNATDLAAVATALAAAKALIDAVPTTAENTAAEAAATLAIAKTTAINTIEGYVTALTVADYSATNWLLIGMIQDNAIAAVNLAGSTEAVAAIQDACDADITAVQTISAINELFANAFRTTHSVVLALTTDTVKLTDESAVNTAWLDYGLQTDAVKVALDGVETLLTALRNEIVELQSSYDLATAKTEAIAVINAYWGAYETEEDFDETEKADIATARTDGVSAVNTATDLAGVSSALTAAKTAIDAVLTSAEKTAAALVTAKTEAITALNSYWGATESQSDFDADGLAAIATARTAGVAAINAATNTEAVDDALATAKGTIDAVQTQDEIWQAAANAFKSAHGTILDKTVETVEIEDSELVTAALAAYEALDENVQATLSEELALLNNLKARIAELVAAAELADAKTAAITELNAYWGVDKTEADFDSEETATIVAAQSAGETAITAAATLDEVAEALADAKAAIDGVETQTEAWARLAAEFKENHSTILGKTTDTLQLSDKADLDAALLAYGILSAGVTDILENDGVDDKLDALETKMAELVADSEAPFLVGETKYATWDAAVDAINTEYTYIELINDYSFDTNTTLSNGLVVNGDVTLTVAQNVTLTIDEGGFIESYGTIANNGTITGDGALINWGDSGTIEGTGSYDIYMEYTTTTIGDNLATLFTTYDTVVVTGYEGGINDAIDVPQNKLLIFAPGLDEDGELTVYNTVTVSGSITTAAGSFDDESDSWTEEPGKLWLYVPVSLTGTGSIENNGELLLLAEEAVLTIDNGATLTNNGYISTEPFYFGVYKEDYIPLPADITNKGYIDTWAFVGSQTGLESAFAISYLTNVQVVVESVSAENRTVTMEDITIPDGVTLYVTCWIADETNAVTQVILEADSITVKEGAELYIRGIVNVTTLNIEAGGTVTIAEVYTDDDGITYPHGELYYNNVVDAAIVEVGNYTDLANALNTSYVREITITGNIELTGTSFDLSRPDDVDWERSIVLADNVTLTVPENCDLHIHQGVTLVVSAEGAKLVNNGHINVFGNLTEGWENNYTEGENGSIDFYLDVIHFAEMLATQLINYDKYTAVTDEQIATAQNNITEGWPSYEDDSRAEYYAYAVVYGELEPTTDTWEDGSYTYWVPYNFISYGTAMDILDGVWAALGNAGEMTGVGIDWADNDNILSYNAVENLLYQFQLATGIISTTAYVETQTELADALADDNVTEIYLDASIVLDVNGDGAEDNEEDSTDPNRYLFIWDKYISLGEFDLTIPSGLVFFIHENSVIDASGTGTIINNGGIMCYGGVITSDDNEWDIIFNPDREDDAEYPWANYMERMGSFAYELAEIANVYNDNSDADQGDFYLEGLEEESHITYGHALDMIAKLDTLLGNEVILSGVAIGDTNWAPGNDEGLNHHWKEDLCKQIRDTLFSSSGADDNSDVA